MKRRTQWIVALLVAGATGWTTAAMAGPGAGPYGPWNSGGAYGGFGPYEPFVRRGYDAKEGLSNSYYSRSACYDAGMPSEVAESAIVTEEPAIVETAPAVESWSRPVRMVRTGIYHEVPAVVEEEIAGPPVVGERIETETTWQESATPRHSEKAMHPKKHHRAKTSPSAVGEKTEGTLKYHVKRTGKAKATSKPNMTRSEKTLRQTTERSVILEPMPVQERTSAPARALPRPTQSQKVGPPHPSADNDYSNPYR